MQGMVSNVPVGLGDIVTSIKLLMMESVPFDLIISDLTQIKLRTKIDKYHATVKVRAHGKTETLNL